MENPEIRSIEATGYGPGQPQENEDCRENRLEFAMDHLSELSEYLKHYPEILDDFIFQNSWRYKAWLN